VTPEWWLLSILPLAFAALTVEMLFRIVGSGSPSGAADDAVSTG